jgi:RNA polymerase sigma factor (sigma-70 family)
LKESDLIAGLALRKNASINWLIDEYHGYIYAVTFNIVKRREESEEATQDSLLKIINRISEYEQGKAFKAWIFTIAYRTAIDYYRRKKTIEPEEKLIYHSSPDSTDDGINNKEKNVAIEKMLSHLSEEDATLVRLFYLNEMSIKELVLATNLSESNIKIKLYRARKEMAKYATNYLEN